MKESKFIELLNLYIDQEIAPNDVALLEEEIQSNPERRRVYLQYCRMHRANEQLFERSRAGNVPLGSKLAAAARAANEKVVAFPEPALRHRLRWAYVGGLVAAAACVAFVFVRPLMSPEPVAKTGGMVVAQQTPAPVRPIARVEAPSPQPVARPERSQFVSVFAAYPLDNGNANAGAVFTQHRENLQWMQRVQLVPMQATPADNLVFETQPAWSQDQGVYRNVRPVKLTTEKAAFQFQR